MGCIVNGPGEMADADFGYVGGAPGKIDLYVGKEVVRRAIPMDSATDELIELIKVRSHSHSNLSAALCCRDELLFLIAMLVTLHRQHEQCAVCVLHHCCGLHSVRGECTGVAAA